jgi:hypothetical protein
VIAFDNRRDDGGVRNSEPIVWRATREGRHDAWRTAGQIMLLSLIPTVLICGTGGLMDEPAVLRIGGLSLVVFTVIAGGYGIGEVVRDRRSVVRVELLGDEFTLVRRDGIRAVHPAREIRRIEVIRTVHGSGDDSVRLELHVGDRVEKTRRGGPHLPGGWTEAVTIAEVETKETRHHRGD